VHPVTASGNKLFYTSLIYEIGSEGKSVSPPKPLSAEHDRKYFLDLMKLSDEIIVVMGSEHDHRLK
jgi:hypothetical protein